MIWYHLTHLFQGCFDGDLKLDGSTPMIYWNERWSPICGHHFWDNDIGASLFCQQLGFGSGKIKQKYLTLPSDGLWVGGCRDGDKWLQCSNPKCNQLKIGGQCNDSPGYCDKGVKAAFSIECVDSGKLPLIRPCWVVGEISFWNCFVKFWKIWRRSEVVSFDFA